MGNVYSPVSLPSTAGGVTALSSLKRVSTYSFFFLTCPQYRLLFRYLYSWRFLKVAFVVYWSFPLLFLGILNELFLFCSITISAHCSEIHSSFPFQHFRPMICQIFVLWCWVLHFLLSSLRFSISVVIHSFFLSFSLKPIAVSCTCMIVSFMCFPVVSISICWNVFNLLIWSSISDPSCLRGSFSY